MPLSRAFRLDVSRPRSGSNCRGAVALLVAVLCAGCVNQADSAQADVERQRPVQRYDVVQTLASNGVVTVAGSQSGAVMKSADRGRTWQRQDLGSASIIGLAACPDGSFVGIDFRGKVWSADRIAGAWKSVALDKPRVPLAVTCDRQGRWWVAGSGAAIAGSADRGATWTVTELEDDVQFTTVQFVDDTHGFVLGEFGHVMATEDGGLTWKKLASIEGDFYPYAALFRDRKKGWTSGLAGQVLQTRDGGKSWQKMDNRSGVPLYRLFMHGGQPLGTGAGGVVAALDQGVWQSRPYSDAVPVFLGAGASLGESGAGIAVGGPAGVLRVISLGDKPGAGS